MSSLQQRAEELALALCTLQPGRLPVFVRLTVNLGLDRSLLKLPGRGNRRIRRKRVKRMLRQATARMVVDYIRAGFEETAEA